MIDLWKKRAPKSLRLFLTPRSYLAETLLLHADEFEQKLRQQPHVQPEIIEALLTERERIRARFEQRIPEYTGRVVVCVTPPHQAPLAVFVWEGRLFVLVSATEIGYPIDHAAAPGLLAWPWLVEHEAVHIRRGHLKSMFWARRVSVLSLLAASWIGFFYSQFASIPPQAQMVVSWSLGCCWLVQWLFRLGCECSADIRATARIDDPAVLEDAKKTLVRWTTVGESAQGWLRLVGYLIRAVLLDPHPPVRARLWLLNRRIGQLGQRQPRDVPTA